MPDYATYSLEELKEAYTFVDKESYPENYKSIIHEIHEREKECEKVYVTALQVLRDGGGEEKATPLFRDVANKFPGTDNGKKAHKFLQGKVKSLPAEFTKGIIGNELGLVFRGSTKEYFRIWIVNLGLTLLTCGVFSAWAKVRSKKYIYSTILLDGTPFQYLGRPLPILKGRLIVVILFLIYCISQSLYPSTLSYVIIGSVLIAPFVFVQSAALNARCTAYRNMSFCFHGRLFEAVKVVSGRGIIPALVICTLFGWWGYPWVAAFCLIPFSFFFPVWLKELKKFLVEKISFGGVFTEFHATGGEFFRVYFICGFITFIIGLFLAFVTVSLLAMVSGIIFQIFFFLSSGMTYLGYLFAYAYLQANITNTVWNKMKFGPLSFTCTLTTQELFAIYITNVFGILCSLGLLIPWAVVRTLRYRVENTIVHLNGSMADFKVAEVEGMAAQSNEMTELFEIDLAI